MENTLENKAKFFAQYWGQEVLSHNEYNSASEICSTRISAITKSDDYFNGYYLELKPLSSISDEDAIEIGYDNKEQAVKLLSYGDKDSYDVDYFRSKGYALPYMGLSVEQLIEYGWVKLKNN